MTKQQSRRVIGLFSATAVVVANMIGTGLFTTTGFLIEDLQNPWVVLLTWLTGGLAALCGALTYAEMGADMPRSGGEYHYLRELFHPVAGFLAGWISLIVGFSAPVAAVAVAFSRYLASVIPGLPVIPVALLAVLVFSLIHLWNVKAGAKVQNVITSLKVLLIIILVAGGFVVSAGDPAGIGSFDLTMNAILSPAFATGLIFVMFAYSGWNASAYLAGEIKRPAKNLPLSLTLGTLLVIFLYILVNYFFLSAVPAEAITGKVEVAYYVARSFFGDSAGIIVSLLIAVFLLSTLSSMVMAGPRVYKVMGEDYRLFRFLSRTSKGGAPWAAVLLQMALAMILILTFAFDKILIYVGFTLSLVAAITVGGIFIHRKRGKKRSSGYKTPAYPVTPLVFILIMSWMVVHTLITEPVSSIAGLATLASGVLVYYIATPDRQGR